MLLFSCWRPSPPLKCSEHYFVCRMRTLPGKKYKRATKSKSFRKVSQRFWDKLSAELLFSQFLHWGGTAEEALLFNLGRTAKLSTAHTWIKYSNIRIYIYIFLGLFTFVQMCFSTIKFKLSLLNILGYTRFRKMDRTLSIEYNMDKLIKSGSSFRCITK